MKMFTKLALVSSMAISANAMAMQSMDDAALSAATGQDGINIGIGISKIEIDKVLIHDNNGLDSLLNGGSAGTVFADQAAVDAYNSANGTTLTLADINPTTVVAGSLGGTGNAGAIVIKGNGTGKTATKGIVIEAPVNAAGNAYDTSRKLASGLLAELVIDTDAGNGTDNGGNSAFLNVAAKVSGLDIYIGEIGVSASNASVVGDVRRGNNSANYNAILSGLTLKTGKMDANIQLGAAPQGAMIVLNTTMSGGLEISNLGILDNSTKGKTVAIVSGTPVNTTAAGEINLGSIKIKDANSGTTGGLTMNAKVNVFGKSLVNNGFLRITTGSGTTYGQALKAGDSQDMYISTVKLGSKDAGSIGDVEIQGMTTYYNNGAGFSATNANERAGAMITISGH
ncbi:hypothetical protein F908_01198 [Acinetobacter sp. NIPH 284]|uniref:putative pilus system protein FilA n=1 Tax=Acinetobacter sp. NIPH 284 TaxID=1217704 RepID=UPI0002CE8F6D|nr:DUF6160 family protein [Acinetobacter sp. NIPH 284]ENW83328.1 hypothetical protein F908_01198 [Acinetobacter sp. NIPH 284]